MQICLRNPIIACSTDRFSRDPTFFHPGSRIRIIEFKYFNPKKQKKWFLSSTKYDPGCSCLIPDPDADFLPIPDPGVKKAPDPGSATLVLAIYCCWNWNIKLKIETTFKNMCTICDPCNHQGLTQPYHFQADLIWWDGTFKSEQDRFIL